MVNHPLGGEDDDLMLDDDADDQQRDQEQPAEDDADQEQPDADQPPVEDDDEADEDQPPPRRLSRKAREAENRRQKAIRQKRALQEERRMRAEAEARAAAAEARAAELESSSADSNLARIDRELEHAERQAQAAYEAGDAAGMAKANRILGKLEAEKIYLERSKKPAPVQREASGDQTAAMMESMPIEFVAWSARHGDVTTWSPAERRILGGIADDLRAEGYDDVAEALPELERRLRPMLPHRFPKQAVRQRNGAYDLRAPAAPPPVSSGRASQPTSGPNRTLTQQERNLMRAMGRDPSDPAHVATFVRANPRPTAGSRAGR